jgi:hypothetical protein
VVNKAESAIIKAKMLKDEIEQQKNLMKQKTKK